MPEKFPDYGGAAGSFYTFAPSKVKAHGRVARACFQNPERGPSSVAAMPPDRPFPIISNGLAVSSLLRPGTGALRPQFENTPSGRQIFKADAVQFNRSAKKYAASGAFGHAPSFKSPVKSRLRGLALCLLSGLRLRVLLWIRWGRLVAWKRVGAGFRLAAIPEEQGVTQRTRPMGLPVAQIAHD
jgi:hypothetical protein